MHLVLLLTRHHCGLTLMWFYEKKNQNICTNSNCICGAVIFFLFRWNIWFIHSSIQPSIYCAPIFNNGFSVSFVKCDVDSLSRFTKCDNRTICFLLFKTAINNRDDIATVKKSITRKKKHEEKEVEEWDLIKFV